MSDLERVVGACEALTKTVEQQADKINQANLDAIESLNKEKEELEGQVPRLCVSSNPFLQLSENSDTPSGLMLHSDVTSELFMSIPRAPHDRDVDQLRTLQEMEADLGVSLRTSGYFDQSFNIIKLSWNEVTNTNWLAFPAYSKGSTGAYPAQGLLTYGAFVKVLSGEISGYWGEGSTLNKWHFGNGKLIANESFGSYFHPHPRRQSDSGSILVALPFVTTGSVTKANQWFPQVIA